MHPERYFLRLIAGIAEAIGPGEIHLIRAVPEQPLLAVIQPQRGVRARLFQWQCDPALLLHRAHTRRAVFCEGHLLVRNNLVAGRRWRLLLRRSPGRRYTSL